MGFELMTSAILILGFFFCMKLCQALSYPQYRNDVINYYIIYFYIISFYHKCCNLNSYRTWYLFHDKQGINLKLLALVSASICLLNLRMSYKFLLKQKDYLLNCYVGYSWQDCFHIHFFICSSHMWFSSIHSHTSVYSTFTII